MCGWTLFVCAYMCVRSQLTAGTVEHVQWFLLLLQTRWSAFSTFFSFYTVQDLACDMLSLYFNFRLTLGVLLSCVLRKRVYLVLLLLVLLGEGVEHVEERDRERESGAVHTR